MLDAALELAAAGVSVIPVRADGSKAPAVAWKPYITARADEATLRGWFTGQSGVGVVTGHVSGDLELLEVEGRASDRMPEVVELVNGSGLTDLWRRINNGWLEMSPSGGWHWFYRLDDAPPGNQKIAVNAAGETLAETRGTGGYVVVAPTGGTAHETGRPWERVVGGPGTVPTVSRDERDALIAVFAAVLDDRPTAAPPAPIAATWTVTARHDGTLSPGDDFEARIDWADQQLLGGAGWTHVYTLGRERYWRRPGKTIGISASTGHADDRDRLWVWSTSTGVFPTEEPITKLGAYAYLHHGGDFAAAARALRTAGYGDPSSPPAMPAQTATDGPVTPVPAPGAPAPVDLFEKAVQAEINRLDINAEAKQRRTARDALDSDFPASTRLDAFLAEPDLDPEWRITDLWPTGGNILLAAQYKAGKSTLVGNMLRSFADGSPLLDQYDTKPCRVVLIDNELDARTLRRWLRDQGIVNTTQIRLVSLRGRTALFDLTIPEVRARWAQLLTGADVLVFDCLRPVLDALGLSEDKDAGIFLTGLDALKHEARIGEAAVVHHMGHSGERARGDSRLKDWPDVTWTIVREEPDDPSSGRYFKAYGRDVDIAETALAYDHPTRHLSLGHGSRKEQAAAGVLADVLALLRQHGELSGRQIEAELLGDGHEGRNELRAAIKLGVSRGEILTRQGPRNSLLHSVNPVSRAWND